MCKLHVLCKIGITLCSPGGCAMLQGVLCCSIPYSRIAVRGSSAIQGFHLKTEPNRVHENSDQQQLQHPRLWHCSDIAHVVETQLIWWFCAWLLIWFLRTVQEGTVQLLEWGFDFGKRWVCGEWLCWFCAVLHLMGEWMNREPASLFEFLRGLSECAVL